MSNREHYFIRLFSARTMFFALTYNPWSFISWKNSLFQNQT